MSVTEAGPYRDGTLHRVRFRADIGLSDGLSLINPFRVLGRTTCRGCNADEEIQYTHPYRLATEQRVGGRTIESIESTCSLCSDPSTWSVSMSGWSGNFVSGVTIDEWDVSVLNGNHTLNSVSDCVWGTTVYAGYGGANYGWFGIVVRRFSNQVYTSLTLCNADAICGSTWGWLYTAISLCDDLSGSYDLTMDELTFEGTRGTFIVS